MGELRVIFPVIQRLQWTKWANWELVVHIFVRHLPTYRIYINIGKPTKFQRCILQLLRVSILMLGSCVMLSFETANEEITAINRPIWELFEELFGQESNPTVFVTAVVMDIISGLIAKLCASVFFGFSLPKNRRPPMSPDQRKAQLLLWHSLADFGRFVCIMGIVLAVLATAALCSMFPQPRAVQVVRSFFLSLFFAYFVVPVSIATVATLILDVARAGPMFDGLLTLFPGIMDFVSVGVQTPAFLAWRVERIVNEMELMRRVHHEPPVIGGPADPESSSDED